MHHQQSYRPLKLRKLTFNQTWHNTIALFFYHINLSVKDIEIKIPSEINKLSEKTIIFSLSAV